MKLLQYFFLFSSLLITVAFVQAQALQVPAIFSDNMVLQRDSDITVWGTGKPGHTIHVTLEREQYRTVVPASGKWEVTIPPHSAGGSYNLRIIDYEDHHKKDYLNVTFGDIWLCGGQSNMEWFTENALHGKAEVAAANHPDIRLLTVPRKIANKPQEDILKTNWQICTPKSVAQFSAVGYFFGRLLNDSLGVPIGLINDNWGGTVAEAWASEDAFVDLPNYKAQIDKLHTINPEKESKSGDAAFNQWLESFKNEDAGRKGDTFVWAKKAKYRKWKSIDIPTQWEAAGQKELEELDGVVWFQKNIVLTAHQAATAKNISLGTIDDSEKTWINGHLVGEMYNRYNKDRFYAIPAGILKEGDNSIVVRVEDYIGGGGLYGKPEKLFIETKNEKIPLAGSWHYKIGYACTTPMPRNGFGPNAYPSMLYNGMIAPIRKFAIKGVIWYQGESNVERAVEYRDIFRRLILDWQKQFNNSTLPFLFVQLANFMTPQVKPQDSKWAELREAQASVLDLPGTAMITAIDIGEAGSIHPLNKQEVGRRLALAAVREVYGIYDISYKGPVYEKMTIKGNRIIIHFAPDHNPLKASGKKGFIKGFTISGADKVFHWAKAKITGDHEVTVWARDVAHPVAVRYAWANNPQNANLYNTVGFPAYPFRTDDWELSTQNTKRN